MPDSAADRQATSHLLSTVEPSAADSPVAALLTQIGADVAAAAGCDTLETLLGHLDELEDKSTGTRRRVLDQVMSGGDCDTCPPGFLAALTDLAQVVSALRIATSGLLAATPGQDQ